MKIKLISKNSGVGLLLWMGLIGGIGAILVGVGVGLLVYQMMTKVKPVPDPGPAPMIEWEADQSPFDEDWTTS